MLARGSAVADFDNDGDLDVAVNSIGGRSRCFENDGATGTLARGRAGRVPPRRRGDGDAARRSRAASARSHAGSSYLSSEDPRCHFGLGDAGTVRELVVRWPGGQETVLEDVDANQILEVEPPG